MDHSPISAPHAPAPLSREIADAAEELACRIDLGEFDDLEDTQMADLRMLSSLMAQWAEHAQAIEQRATLPHGTTVASQSPVAFRN